MRGQTSSAGIYALSGLSSVPLEVGEAKYAAICSHFMVMLNSTAND